MNKTNVKNKPVKPFDRDSLLNFKQEHQLVTFKDNTYPPIYVRTISSGERIKWEAIRNDENGKDLNELAVIMGVCDEQGVRLFTEADLDAVKKLPMALVNGMALAVLKANSMYAEDVELAEGN